MGLASCVAGSLRQAIFTRDRRHHRSRCEPSLSKVLHALWGLLTDLRLLTLLHCFFASVTLESMARAKLTTSQATAVSSASL